MTRLYQLKHTNGHTYTLKLHPDLTVTTVGNNPHPYLPWPGEPRIELTDTDLTATERWQVRRFARHVDELGHITDGNPDAREEWQRLNEVRSGYFADLALHRALIALGDRSLTA